MGVVLDKNSSSPREGILVPIRKSLEGFGGILVMLGYYSDVLLLRMLIQIIRCIDL
jgi:hypothetical protein